jgi:hypothetical protein
MKVSTKLVLLEGFKAVSILTLKLILTNRRSKPLKMMIVQPMSTYQVTFVNRTSTQHIVENTLITEKPCMVQKLDSVEREFPDVFPDCAVNLAETCIWMWSRSLLV